MKITNAKHLQMTDEEIKTYKRFDTIFRLNGFDPEEGREVSMRDAMGIAQASFMVPRVLTNFVQEGHEPMLVGTNLLQRIEYTPGMTTVFPSISTLTAREVGDNMSLPIFNIDMGGAQVFGLSVKRHGLQIRVNQKFIDQSTYPWLQWWLKLAGQALARHKEEYIFSFLTSMGTSIFDNDPAARVDPPAAGQVQPIKGATTGRNIKGQYNGSMTLDDVFDMYAQVLMQGFVPNTLLVHPLTWIQWVKDPLLREFAIVNGGGSFFANWTGNAAAQAYKGVYNFNGLGQGVGNSPLYKGGQLQATPGTPGTQQGMPQDQTSAPVLPSYLGLSFRIVVSPFVRFDPLSRTTDMMLFDSNNLGALVVDEDPHVVSWSEPGYGINNIGIEETFGLAILNEAQAIGTAKNISIKANEFILPARSYFNIAEADTTFQQAADITNFGAAPTDVNAV
jgi:hypothetical protein